ncbi:MAG: NERD domain-containing protein [Methanophagales archaeon]|nr:NERD domain-containing protein [Methanophagales archaeon]
MRILKEAKYGYLRDKAKRNRNYTLIASLPLFIFILFIIYALFFDQEFFFVLGFWWLAVLYILVPSHLLRKYLNYKKGIRGEKEVTTALQKLNDSYYLLNDVLLYSKAGNIDHLVLGPNGLFVIETKNYKGEISCYGDKWQRHYAEMSYPLPSISKQAKRNAVLLRRFLEEKDHSGLFKNIWVNALVVFVNPHVELALHKPTLPVLRLFELPDFIKLVKIDKSLSDKDLRALGDVIFKNAVKR